MKSALTQLYDKCLFCRLDKSQCKCRKKNMFFFFSSITTFLNCCFDTAAAAAYIIVINFSVVESVRHVNCIVSIFPPLMKKVSQFFWIWFTLQSEEKKNQFTRWNDNNNRRNERWITDKIYIKKNIHTCTSHSHITYFYLFFFSLLIMI